MKESNRDAEVNTPINGDAVADNTLILHKPLPLYSVNQVVSEYFSYLFEIVSIFRKRHEPDRNVFYCGKKIATS